MKKLLQINICSNILSTGKIMEDIGKVAQNAGWNSYVAFGRESKHSSSNEIKIGSSFNVKEHAIETRILDNCGLASRHATHKFVKQIIDLKPDVIHLHNLHGYYINYRILFDCLKELDTKVVWTLHDCWPFTGHCFHPIFVPCDRYLTQCYDCPRKTEYPSSLFGDRSFRNYNDKKKAFLGIKNMTLIACSNWLAGVTKSSFLGNYPIKVIHNGIDLQLFRPKQQTGMVKNKYRIGNGFIILGVASVWGKWKGLDDIIEISKRFKRDNFVLVGLNKKQISLVSDFPNIIGITRTKDQQELVELYSIADVLLNPTYADNFPTVNIEALACGTPVITYDTGGSPEALNSETGMVINRGNLVRLESAINIIKKKSKAFFSDSCRKRAEDFFDKDSCYKKYLQIYENP